MKNIILPIDFSDSTEKLVDYAISFAKDVNAKIHLIHVSPTDIGFVISDMGYQYFPEVEENELKYELKELNRLEQHIIAHDVEADHILKQGNASEVIMDYVAEKAGDYIVMGSHGRSGIYDVFVGSLTKDLTKISNVPVVVVPCRKEK
ncbi:universal stress protein [Soonwooa sp.]|uniref:universal stress protein n=1 Tax=Soonwooa sp. TaxID=1938592 RepID=UPI00260E69ED|nr:universal stress protein [Soonwooa sp.]